MKFKYQLGGGFEYFLKDFSIRLQSQYDLGFDDDWEYKINGDLKQCRATIWTQESPIT